VNLAAAAGSTDDPDFPLRDGDRVFIQYRAEYHELPTVGIVGEIERPGAYPIVLGRDRLSTVIAAAGGFRPQANRSSVYLVRESVGGSAVGGDPEFDRLARLSRNEMTESEYTKLETMLAQRKNNFRVDWNRLQAGNTDLDPLLQNNDVIRVERLVPSVRVEGQVKRPGFVDYEPGRSLGEYIQLAGGFTERSARNTVRVSRALTGQVIPARSLKNVQPGDFIWVPERRDVDAWAAFRDIVTVAGQVAVIIFTLSR
jgi:protein involved in polysaccharide export with SLBB domain